MRFDNNLLWAIQLRPVKLIDNQEEASTLFQHIDPVVGVGFVQRGVILKAKFVLDSR